MHKRISKCASPTAKFHPTLPGRVAVVIHDITSVAITLILVGVVVSAFHSLDSHSHYTVNKKMKVVLLLLAALLVALAAVSATSQTATRTLRGHRELEGYADDEYAEEDDEYLEGDDDALGDDLAALDEDGDDEYADGDDEYADGDGDDAHDESGDEYEEGS